MCYEPCVSDPDESSARGHAVLSWLWRNLHARTRAGIFTATVLALAGRGGALIAAWSYAVGDPRTALLVAVGSAAVFVVRRVVCTWVRLDAERDSNIAAARALLRADVLEEPEVEPHFALASGIYYASDAASNVVPAIGGDLAATAFAASLLVRFLPPSLLLACAVAAGVVVATTVLLRARVAKLQQGATDAQQQLGDALSATLHGRLEIVAAGVEATALARLSRAADRYILAARRATIGTAVLGRAPLGAAMVAVGTVLALGRADVREFWADGLAYGVVLAAALPPILGVVFGAQELIRIIERLGPFATVALRPDRADITRAAAPRGAPQVSAIELDAVEFAYEQGAPNVLDGSSFVWGGGTVVLRGPNGSGKSSVLRLLLGLRDPQAGRVRIGGVDLRDLDVCALRRRIAYVSQRPYLGEPYTTVGESLRLLSPEGVSRARIEQALERTGLSHALERDGADPLERTIGELSVGQRQRLAIARALCRDADVILLDEPDANLDRAGVQLLGRLIEDLRREGQMVAVAAHGPLADEIDAAVWDVEPAPPPVTVRPGRTEP